MKIDSTPLSELMVELAVNLFGDRAFSRRALMDATETEIRGRGLWMQEDDILSGSVGVKSRGLATIDYRFSDLARTGSLISERRDSWRVVQAELMRMRSKVPQAPATASRSEPMLQQENGALTAMRPNSKKLVYDLVTQAGVDTSDWANYKKSAIPAANPKYCYNWSFEGPDRVVVCLWFEEMRTDGEAAYQVLNYRNIAASPRQWDANQRMRAAGMDHAIQAAKNKRLPIRVIVVDGSRRRDADDETRSHVERRMLDPESWHVATYDVDGNCRLQRGPWPDLLGTFTPAEIVAVGTFTEGTRSEITTKIRERSARLRDLAREHFARQSPDGRLHCGACDWAPPLSLALSGPIVEIHHGVGISDYPTDGKALTFAQAIEHLTPLCPNCHRVLHAKLGSGIFTLEQLRESQGHCASGNRAGFGARVGRP